MLCSTVYAQCKAWLSQQQVYKINAVSTTISFIKIKTPCHMFQPSLVTFSKFHHQNYNYCICILVTNAQRTITPEQSQQQLCSEVRTALLCLQIVVCFCPGKWITALSYPAPIKVFLWDSGTNAESCAELDLWCKRGLWCLPAYPSIQYFCNHALAMDFRMSNHPTHPQHLYLIPPSRITVMKHL
jgi:hypothetical protein